MVEGSVKGQVGGLFALEATFSAVSAVDIWEQREISGKIKSFLI